ncbi:maleylpyruvate isomerase family mycothiol-dependent enzyme [Saccharopolyspora rhizosphaerae]|uniref:Maleylpyruvate isomerase family mycothiol-dependent enzyme n=1 Tax=Saccharopolyspora rhizosphaerae TaxID=2492662 RepID=A0A426JWP1_9PSEU|nr:maleylpyruvate isomerase N-terminal domain-containing protein [Saccharopolyspora rhizosphaerae]RRO17491.1 maleylpyruvate isomerase family mycothiol-dependent enzyme [Saccharopolyspora rhizosphaerae]
MADIVLGTGRWSEAALTDEVADHLARIDHVTEALVHSVTSLDELSVRQPSLLPGWSRAHVITHLARNADACSNLLLWARTGIEHPMYASRDDRDQAIHKGASRSHRLLLEDLVASSDRFSVAARAMPTEDWTAEVSLSGGDDIPALHVLRLRLLEAWVHLVDLDHDVDFPDIPSGDAELLLEDVTQQLGGRHDVPAVSVEVDFGTHHRTWDLRGTTSEPAKVTGEPGPVLGWLLGRTGPEELSGDAPELPPWM